MKWKNTIKRWTICLAVLILIAASPIGVVQQKVYAENNASLISVGESTVPTMSKPAWIDHNNNKIADSLDIEIAERMANDTSQSYANVIVSLVSAPSDSDLKAFAFTGGGLTAGPWKNAIYGFGGTIPYYRIADFVQRCPDILLIEKEAVYHSCLAYATQQAGARTYVWNTLGLQGDPNSSTAIVDSGIDASHPDFSPGFGDQNFSMKVVGWNDQINNSSTPFDDNGHGSHCAGIEGGNGFFSVDASGNALATCSGFFGWMSAGNHTLAGVMVNKTGTITAKIKWACIGGRTNITRLSLCNGNKNLNESCWTQVASVNTLDPNTWYTLSYNLSSTPTGGYDMYHLRSNISFWGGLTYFLLTISFPYAPPTDGFSAWTGIAPQTKLAGVKVLDANGSGNATTIINGIDWIIAHKSIYHITVASMSLGGSQDDSSIDSAVVSLVNSGITTVVAAGNDGPGMNYIYTPGSVDEVITVSAMNQFDNIASYSSQGGPSNTTGNTLKPDITAPGGSSYSVPILSADTNCNDAFGVWNDTEHNDAATNLGTSMATPIVAGAAQIVIQAMGGYAGWQWTRSQALKPKMILLMTATETYPNVRETYSASPTLNRGGKDVHEGYGRLNLDAAVDAVTQTYQIGSTVNGTLGKPPSLNDISVLGEKLAWARKVQMVTDYKYNFTLTVPTGADYDLYVYKGTGTGYGEPIILAKSTTNATGGVESIIIDGSPYTGEYYLVVKRATETTGNGTFTLQSSVTSGGGGCPYVYTWNGSTYAKDNNILPASESGNGTDVKDNYKLEQLLVPIRVTQQTSIYSLQIREFEDEQDYIDQVELTAVDHSPNTSIAVTAEGEIVTYASPGSPLTCFDNNNTSRLNEVSGMDGNVSDPSTYFQGYEGDWLLFNFGRVTAANANLILRDDQKCMDVCIEVQIPGTNHSWKTIEVLHPRDQWAIEAVSMTAYLPANDDLIVRLLWTATHRLDYVGLDTSTPVAVQVRSVAPALAIHSALGNVTVKLLCDDENCVELINGQRITLAFILPSSVQGMRRDFIIYTNGYYYVMT